jgi:hypothetical protein
VVGEERKPDPAVAVESAPPEFSLANAEVLFGNRSIGWYRWASWFAEKIQGSKMIPFDSPQEAFAVLCKGDELGLPPFAAWNLLYMTRGGRLSLMSKGALAVVQSKPTFEGYTERIEGTGEDMKAVATAKRKGFQPTTKEFTFKQAERAGLLKPRTNQYNKAYESTYQTFLEDMLLARARARALDIAFAAELGGIPIEGAAEDADMMEERRRSPAPAVPAEKPKDKKLLGPGRDPLIDLVSRPAAEPLEAELVPATLVETVPVWDDKKELEKGMAEIEKSVEDAFGPSEEKRAAEPAQPGAGTPAEGGSAPGGADHPPAGPAPGSATPKAAGPKRPTCPKCGKRMHPTRGCDACFVREEKAKEALGVTPAAPCPRCKAPLNIMNGCDACGYPGEDLR